MRSMTLSAFSRARCFSTALNIEFSPYLFLGTSHFLPTSFPILAKLRPTRTEVRPTDPTLRFECGFRSLLLLP